MTQPRLLGGRYELDGIVGRGGMAEVFRARDIRLDRIVAVKTLRDDLARDQTFQARFRREAQSAASLNHPSIVAVYDTGEDELGPTPVPYIVMEYVDGRTLRDLLRDDRRLLPERAAEITDGVLRALDYSHRNGIVHRDIKPGNVMLTRSGEVKVMDFGIARAVSDAQATMTQTAQVIGTAQYLSPEQARGERVDARSDLYSTGCLMYELLTGRPPFTGDSPVAIAYQHVREDPIPPSRVDPEVPRWADAIVLKAMAKDPADRYQSAGEMRSDIQRALSGAPVAAPLPGDLYAAGTRRMGSATQLAGPTSAIPPYDYASGDGRGGPPQSEQRRAWPWVVLAVIVLLLIAAGVYGFRYISSPGGSISVPNVTGDTLPAAQHAIVNAGLTLGPTHDAASSTIAKNHVISTSPSEGSYEPKGTAVVITVSTGPSSVTVPPVVGDQAGQAQAALQKANLSPSILQVVSTRPAGTVVSQSPAAGQAVAPGSVVKIYVSQGGTRVPSVVGQSAAQARATLTAAGFTVQAAYGPGPGAYLPGYVYQQSPSGVQSPGTTITIYIVQPTASSSPPASTSPSPTPTSTTPTTTPSP